MRSDSTRLLRPARARSGPLVPSPGLVMESSDPSDLRGRAELELRYSAVLRKSSEAIREGAAETICESRELLERLRRERHGPGSASQAGLATIVRSACGRLARRPQ